jgi:uncharacterized membrane protein YgcG
MALFGNNAPVGDDASVERTRARMGLIAVAVSDVVIAVAAIWGVVLVHKSGNVNATSVVSILTSAFTAIGTLTTAYLGIKASANTAKNALPKTPTNSSGGSSSGGSSSGGSSSGGSSSGGSSSGGKSGS